MGFNSDHQQTVGLINKCIHTLFEEQAELTPGAVAVVFEDQQLTYQELNARANQLAHHLIKCGVGPEVLVGLSVDRSLDLIVGILGILKAGGAYLPLEHEYPKERLACMIDDASITVLVTKQKLLSFIPETATAKIVLIDLIPPGKYGECEENPVSCVTPDNLAYVIYTSGTSGKPKGVLVSHYNVVRLFISTDSLFAFNPCDVWTLFHSYSFDFSVWEMWGALLYGGRLIVVPYLISRSPKFFFQLLQKEQVTVLNQTPSAFRQLVQENLLLEYKKNLTLRLVIFGGDTLEVESLRPWFHVYGDSVPTLVNMYGLTEATVHATYYRLSSGDIDISVNSVIGTPLADLQVFILDSSRQRLQADLPGELHIGGAGLARGYLNRPELTAEKFISDPFSDVPGARLYKTGDLARYRSDGTIEFLGRIDHQVKIRGFRIELGEIEAVLMQYSAIREVVAVAREDMPGDKRIVAYVVPKAGLQPTTSELRRFLATKFPEYMIPSLFIMLKSLPLTVNGKIDRRALPAPDSARPELEDFYVAPRTPVEQKIAEIWRELLGLEQVGINDNFFELGGDSLHATQVLSLIRIVFEVELPSRRLFESPTVSGLADNIQSALLTWQRIEEPAILPVARTTVLHLSFAQQRLWFLHRWEPENACYNVPFSLRITGNVNITALGESLNEIIRRHETLRTTFIEVDGKPLQKIALTFDLKLALVELSEEEAYLNLACLTGEEVRRPFDLAQGLPVRATVYRLSEEEHVLIVVMHHIVTDGWSMGVFFHELSVLYGAFSEGRPSPLPDLSIQYMDFAVWQRKRLEGDILENQLNYWGRQLDGVGTFELPTDRPRPPIQTFRGAVRSFSLTPELCEMLRSLGRRENATMFITLLAAFQTLLYRYTGQDDMAIGSPIANRNRVELEPLIGFFVNTLVLRTSLAGNPTFRELLGRVRETALEAYAHQDLPFEKLVEELNPVRDSSRSPFFQVMLVLANAPVETLEIPGLHVLLEEVDTGTAKFDLTLILTEEKGGIEGKFEYNTDLFDPDTIERMTGHFLTLLEAVAANPDEFVSRLPLLTEAERNRVLIEWNDTKTDYPQNKCIHELFEEQAARTPEAVAVVFEDQQLTYRELNLRANQLARLLVILGVKPDMVVAIALERSIEMIVALLAIFKAGGAYVPLDPDYSMQRLAFMLEDSGARILLTQETLNRQFPFTAELTLCLNSEKELIAGQPDNNLLLPIVSEHLAYVIYTSGSTGKPKGVLTTHGAILNRLMWMQTELKLNASDRILQKTPSSFDVSVWEFFWPLMFGACLVVARPGGHLDNLYMSELMRRERITTMHFVPPMLQIFLGMSETNLNTSLRQVICSGQELPAGTLSRFFEVFPHCELYNFYGPTEASIDVTWFHCSPAETRLNTVPIGRPIANTQIYVLDRQLQPVPVGIPGELHIGGAGLARGYLNRPELTAEKFISDPFGDVPGARLYKTGDLARYRPDGNIEFLGRIDHQVKIRGFRIELGEIEAVLMQYSAIREVVAVAREVMPGDKRIVAYVVPKAGLQPTTSELRRFLAAKLPEYMIPSLFVMLDSLPLTANGKVDRRALPAPDSARPELEDFYVAPRTPIEQKLADIWGELLGLEQVGINDNFFELGGNSLLATQVISRISKLLHVEIPLYSLFEFQTVAGLARDWIQYDTLSQNKIALADILSVLETMSEEEAVQQLETKHLPGK